MSQLLSNGLSEVEEFLGYDLPHSIVEKYEDETLVAKLAKQDIMSIIDFYPPFLRTEKLVIFGQENVENSKSIGIGKVFQSDTIGHYNNTIYLAFAGRLMPTTASIHLAFFFPDKAPQAIEGRSIRMDKNAYNSGLIKPGKDGTIFFVETQIIKRKLNLVLASTSIMFGNAKFGLIQELKFILASKDSIRKAVFAPEV